MQYVQEWVSVRFGFLPLHQHLNGHIDFQERVGGWHSPPAQVPNAAFRESGGPFPRGWPYRGPICFAFYLSFLRFLSKSIQFWKSPIRIGDLPFRLVTCPLGRREPQHWAFFFGFTGSPQTSLFKFNVSFVFCAGFTTLSRLICCFHVCCIWHFPLSLAAFHLSIFSTYHVASFQLALVPSMCSFICQMCPFSSCICSFYFSSICNVCLFSTCILLSHFFCNCHVCLFQICIFQFHFFCIVSPFFQDVNIHLNKRNLTAQHYPVVQLGGWSTLICF